MGHSAVYQYSGIFDRRCRDCSCVVLLREIHLRQIRASLWSEGGSRNEGLGRLPMSLAIRVALGLVVWAGEEVRANGTAMDPMTAFARPED